MDVPQFIAGRFRIEREIGTGGMGTVYLATHLGLERPVAVKIIRREFAGDADVADRFLREARTMAKLRHQHAALHVSGTVFGPTRRRAQRSLQSWRVVVRNARRASAVCRSAAISVADQASDRRGAAVAEVASGRWPAARAGGSHVVSQAARR